jgi:hypothetical protein
MLDQAMQSQVGEAVNRMTRDNYLQSMAEADRTAATAAVFAELHLWSRENLPMGAGEHETEKALNRGLKVVKQKFRSDPTLAPKYGVFDAVTIFTVISALFSIVGWLVKWWRGEE